ncbi:MAG: YcjF family protein [Thainema sp.]
MDSSVYSEYSDINSDAASQAQAQENAKTGPQAHAQSRDRKPTTPFEQLAQMGETAIATTIALGEVVGKSVYDATQPVSGTLTEWGELANQQVYQLIDWAAEGTGQAVTAVGQLPFADRVAGLFRLDWLVDSGEKVNARQAKQAVEDLQQQYPNESALEIAQRIMNQKAVVAGGTGFTSSLIPGVAVALLAIDLAATTAIQAEMVYQIAAAYGFDLKEPARKGELVLVIGLAMGSTNIVKTGLGIFRNIPLAGPVIGASTDIAVLYTVGYAACQYYEMKQKLGSTPTPADLQTIQSDSAAYWATTLEQQAIIDQILTHMYLASQPDKSWPAVVAGLHQASNNLDLSADIAQHLEQQVPLNQLLDQLQPEFALPVLSRCYNMAKAHGREITHEEQTILNQIAVRFNLEAFLTDAIADTADTDAGANTSTGTVPPSPIGPN